jgi:hypothetical protein
MESRSRDGTDLSGLRGRPYKLSYAWAYRVSTGKVDALTIPEGL